MVHTHNARPGAPVGQYGGVHPPSLVVMDGLYPTRTRSKVGIVPVSPLNSQNARDFIASLVN